MANESRRYTPAFKIAAMERMQKGENVSALARELGVRRTLLYVWEEAWKAGRLNLNRPTGEPAPAELGGQAQERIRELEQKVGQQTMLIDFLAGALRRVSPPARKADGSGAAAFTRRSKR